MTKQYVLKKGHSPLTSLQKAYLTLLSIPGIGPKRLQALLENGLNVEAVMTLPPASLAKLGFSSEQTTAIKQSSGVIHSVETWLGKSFGHFVVVLGEPNYPNQLKQIANPPLVLFGIGNQSLLSVPQLAIIGSRSPSLSGQEVTRQLAKDACASGWVITSGLAAGIDATAHKAALEVNGFTIAVMGTGPDVIYPKRHHALANDILDNGGCLLTEFAPGTIARSDHFPRRNRIISGLSLGCLVAEATIKSGSLITARYAVEQGKDVFAIPGNIRNPQTKGCHHLIKQGAKLTEDICDINEEFHHLNLIPPIRERKNIEKTDKENLATDKLLDSVDYEATSVDLVAERSGMAVTDVLAQLLEYELRGLVSAVPGGYIKLGDN